VQSDQSFDLVQGLAIPIPLTAIAEMLGVESRPMHRFEDNR
jgi:cytochrome P450